ALLVPLQVERAGLVLPFDLVEVQEAGELPLAGVGKADAIALQAVRGGSRGRVHDPPARTARRPALFVLASDPSRSVHTLSTAMANTPCPLERRSTTASGDSGV